LKRGRGKEQRALCFCKESAGIPFCGGALVWPDHAKVPERRDDCRALVRRTRNLPLSASTVGSLSHWQPEIRFYMSNPAGFRQPASLSAHMLLDLSISRHAFPLCRSQFNQFCQRLNPG
jgi:hypothetical protein